MKIIKMEPIQKGKERVCAYVRVSTEKESQLHSFVEQSQYWEQKLSNNPKYVYLGIFADEGISGKAMKNRKELNEMLELARKKQVDKIFVKSISRFARNYTELIEVVRELRDLNIPIVFEKEKIDTFDSKCNLMLSVLASLAEEELHSMSENQKWSIRKNYAKGIPKLQPIFGYNYVDKRYEIKPNEAKTVKFIFEQYLLGNGMRKITQILERKKYLNRNGTLEWDECSVSEILDNEKYIGDCISQKFFVKNLFKREIEGSYRSIIWRIHIKLSYQKRILKESKHSERRQKYKVVKDKPTKLYPLSGKIICGKCGKSYARKTYAKGKTYECIKWSCRTMQAKSVKVCDNNSIKDSIITELLIQAYNECLETKFVSTDEHIELNKKNELLEEESELKSLYTRGYIGKKQYEPAKTELLKKINEQQNRIDTIKRNTMNLVQYRKAATLNDNVAALFLRAIINDWTVTFEFVNGYSTTKSYSNGRAGNVNGKLKLNIKNEDYSSKAKTSDRKFVV